MVFGFLERSVSPLYDLDISRNGHLSDTNRKARIMREEKPPQRSVSPRGVLNPVKSQGTQHWTGTIPRQKKNQVGNIGTGGRGMLLNTLVSSRLSHRTPTKPIPIRESSSSCWKTRNPSERQQRMLLAEQDAEYRAHCMYARYRKKNISSQQGGNYCSNTRVDSGIWNRSTETRRQWIKDCEPWRDPWSSALVAMFQVVYDGEGVVPEEEEEEEDDHGQMAVLPPWQGWPGSPPHRIDDVLSMQHQALGQPPDEGFDLAVPAPSRSNVSLMLKQESARKRYSLPVLRDEEEQHLPDNDSWFLMASDEEPPQGGPSSLQLRAVLDACATIDEEEDDDDDEALFQMDDI